MQVILLKKVHNLGALGDVVPVKPGYGRNYLIPQGLATSASEAHLAKFAARRAELERAEKAAFQAAEERAKALADSTVTITTKVGDEGRLFGSIGAAVLAEAMTAQRGVTVVKSEVRLPTGALRQAGEHLIVVQLHADVAANVKVQIVAE